MGTPGSAVDRRTRAWLVASVAFGGLLVLGAFIIPTYAGSTSETLVQANGKGVVVVISLPLIFALVASSNMALRRHYGRSGVGTFTWVIIGLLGALVFVGALTIGMFVAPVPICLLMAALRIKELEKSP